MKEQMKCLKQIEKKIERFNPKLRFNGQPFKMSEMKMYGKNMVYDFNDRECCSLIESVVRNTNIMQIHFTTTTQNDDDH